MPQEDLQPRRVPFDQEVAERLQTAVQEALERVPELRSVAVVMDWHGELNEGAPTVIWCDRKGLIQPHELDTMLGSISQTVKLLKLQSAVVGSAFLKLVGVAGVEAARKRADERDLKDQDQNN